MNELAIFKGKLDLSDIEKKLLPFDINSDDLVHHSFFKKIYLRTLFIPKRCIIIGKRHRHSTCNILLKGSLILYMGGDKPVKKVEAPFVFESEPGVKKMAYTCSDVMFANVHPTSLTNLEDIEKKFIIPEEEYRRVT